MADFDLIDGSVRKVILSIINSILVLPNRIMVKLDTNNDYFRTYHHPLGVIRITADKAWGFAEEAQSKTKKLFAKLTRAAPDCYAEIEVGAEPAFRTSTKDNTTTPAWGETHDFVVTDFDQCIKITVSDHDVNSDDEVGVAVTTVREILLAGGNGEFPLIHKGEDTGGRIAISSDFFQFSANDTDGFSASTHKGDGLTSGILNVLIASAFGIKGARETLKPSVVVTWGSKNRFQTAIKSDAPGTDINNPFFEQNFRIPVTAADSTSEVLRIAVLDGETEVGSADVPFGDLQKAPEMTMEDTFDLGNGLKVRACLCLRGLKHAKIEEMTLPTREK